jgi:protein-S-isoprenylcysteine O-methyltransferase Ste14
MARPGFKKVWTKIIPKSIERSTYVLFASSALILLFWQWRPLTDVVWNVGNGFANYILMALFVLGWFIVLTGTFMINHFDLFGLRQVYFHSTGKHYTDLHFRTTALYKYMRHPIMLGFIIAFWSAPTMTLGHLIFSIATTGYILIAVQIEERDLTKIFGDDYRKYKENVAGFFPSKKYEVKPKYQVEEQL